MVFTAGTENGLVKDVAVFSPGNEMRLGSLATSPSYVRKVDAEMALAEFRGYCSTLFDQGVTPHDLRFHLGTAPLEDLRPLAFERMPVGVNGVVGDLTERAKQIITATSDSSALTDLIIEGPGSLGFDERTLTEQDRLALRDSSTHNVVYVQDPVGFTREGLIIGRSRNKDRSLEAKILALALSVLGNHIGTDFAPVYTITEGSPSDAFIEFGDRIDLGDEAIIGVGQRTNEKGARTFADSGFHGHSRIYLVYDDQREPVPHSTTIHTDCVFGDYGPHPIQGYRQGVIHRPALRRRVEVLEPNTDGFRVVKKEDFGWALRGPLEFKLAVCGDEDQAAYAANGYPVRPGVVMGHPGSSRLQQERRDQGMEVEFLGTPMPHLHNGGGGARCIGIPFYRA